MAATYNNTVPRFNLTSLAPGRDYTLVLHAAHAKGSSPPSYLTLRTLTPKAEQVAPERVPVERESGTCGWGIMEWVCGLGWIG